MTGVTKTTIVPLTTLKHEARVDSRIIARELGVKHKNLIELINKYKGRLEKWGTIPFKTEVCRHRTGAAREKFALLNESQAVFLLTLSRNTDRVVELKDRLTEAFMRFKESRQIEADYLPFYHALHDEVKLLAGRAHEAGSTTPQEIFHINFNRMINRALGLEPGSRNALSPESRAKITVANLVARNSVSSALERGADHHEVYQAAKTAVETLSAATRLRITMEGSHE